MPIAFQHPYSESLSAPPQRLRQQRSVSGCICSYFHHIHRLVEWVGPGSPVCEEHAQADSLEQAGQNTNGNSVKRSLLSDDTGEDLRYVSMMIELKWDEYIHLEQRRP